MPPPPPPPIGPPPPPLMANLNLGSSSGKFETFKYSFSRLKKYEIPLLKQGKVVQMSGLHY